MYGSTDIMLSQIQPHFLYNSLTTIRQLPIPFERELNHVENYLALERARFQGRLKVEYNIKSEDFAIPPLTLQPIVENAVRHGVLRREEGGTVTIRTQETEQNFLVIVEDDGVGM